MTHLALAMLLAVPVQARLSPDSKLWIEGDSNIRTWECVAQSLEARADVPEAPPRELRFLSVKIPVAGLDCNDSHMDEKLRDALRAGKFPLIEYQLGTIEKWPDTAAGETKLNVAGTLSIAGRVRAVTMVVAVKKLADGSFQVRGSVPLLMSDFEVEPPTAFLGTVSLL